MPGNKNNTGNCCCDVPDPNCCVPYVYYCVCGEYNVLHAGGGAKVYHPEDCCDCGVTPTLTVWLTCPDPPVMPEVLTLNWEYDCDGDTQSGTVDISDVCDMETIIEDVITVTGCTLNDYVSANLEDMALCCSEGCIIAEDTTATDPPGTPRLWTIDESCDETNPSPPGGGEDFEAHFSYTLWNAGSTPVCTGDSFSFRAEYINGREAYTTGDMEVVITLPECMSVEFVSGVSDYDNGTTVVNGVESWNGNELTITFTGVGALNELPMNVDIELTLLACCCDDTDPLDQATVVWKHSLDPYWPCTTFSGCEQP